MKKAESGTDTPYTLLLTSQEPERREGGTEDMEHASKHTHWPFSLDGTAWPRLTIVLVTICNTAITTAGVREILTQAWQHVPIVHSHIPPKIPN